MEEFFLLLYVDSDYIVPLIDSTKGNLFRYNTDRDHRLWLYFREDVDSTDVLYGYDNYRPARMGKASYFGNYWEGVDQGREVEVQGIKTPYVELPRISQMLKDLTGWYRSLFQQHLGPIPTICLFAENIPLKARKCFLEMISENGFSVRSFSLSFNALLAKYHGLSPDYGKQIISVAASGNDVEISSMIYWNDEFVGCDRKRSVKYDGENPVKMALVKHIVDKANRDYGFFTAESIKREYAYQMTFAEEWLKLAAATPSGSSFQVRYHLSLDKETFYTINIQKDFILAKQEELARPIIDAIEYYCAEIEDNDIMQYLFTGEIFSSEDMYRMASHRSPGKSAYIPSAHYAEVLHLYLKAYPDFREELSCFDRIMAERQAERQSATAWFDLASRILEMAERIELLEPDFKLKLEHFEQRVNLAFAESESALGESRFEEADQAIKRLQEEQGELKAFIFQRVNAILAEHASNRSLYERVWEYQYARRIIEAADFRIQTIAHGIEAYNSLAAAIEQEVCRIGNLKSCYPVYLAKKREFDAAQTLAEKRRLIEELRELSAERWISENLADSATLDEVVGEIVATVKYQKRLFGLLGKRPSELNIEVKIGKGRLPYDCFLTLSDRATAIWDESLPSIPLEKGATGTLHFREQLPIARYPKAEKLYLRIFVDREKNALADISKISFNKPTINL
uniref:hypothetical protein n=1 Tax=Alistipes sp. TaxID=1872444 RepID=UPI004055EFFE